MCRLTILLACLLVFQISALRAQQAEQILQLRPGWNAVFLEVHPEPNLCDSIFSGVPIETVWAWNRRFSPVQFISEEPQNLTDLIPQSPDWLSYFPPGHPLAARKTLFTMDGGRTYLIKLMGQSPWPLRLRGRPAIRRPDWVTDGFTLVGFGVDRTSSPTLTKFYGPSPAQAGQRAFRLNALGVWDEVPQPNTSRMTNGEAIFIKSKGASDYTGPLHLVLPQIDRMDFGTTLQEQTIEVRNAATNPVDMALRVLDSVDPNKTDALPLDYWYVSTNGGFRFGWSNLTAIVRSNVLPGKSWQVRVAVRRRDFATPPANPNGTNYQALLEVTESSGSSRWLIPVSAERASVAGLWAGTVSLNKVSEPAVSTNPVPTSGAAQFRLLIHVNRDGEVRLLQKVLQMWKNGTTKPDPQDPDLQVLDTPGRYVLLTDESRAGSYTGSTLRDGRPAGRRLSSVGFGFRSPVSVTRLSGSGDFGSFLTHWGCTVGLDYNDPTNPFRHKFHPDHNNLNEEYSGMLPEGKESFTVTRAIRLEFTGQDPEGLQLAGWGADRTGGIYRESIAGLHKNTLYVQGVFRLQRVSTVPTLDDSP